MSVTSLRTDYAQGELDETTLLASPTAQLSLWLEEAHARGVAEPNAMTLSTASRDGAPSSRIVLLRDVSEAGLQFFTNYESRKGEELRANPRASLLFFWPQLERQVRVEGTVEKLPETASAAYFASRPRGSQLGAWASKQSAVIESREALEASFRAIEARFGDAPIPLPPFWGGYLLVPRRFELWQGRRSRLHDRIAYERSGAEYTRSRLSP